MRELNELAVRAVFVLVLPLLLVVVGAFWLLCLVVRFVCEQVEEMASRRRGS